MRDVLKVPLPSWHRWECRLRATPPVVQWLCGATHLSRSAPEGSLKAASSLQAQAGHIRVMALELVT
jgi:hypothetical protein